MIELDLASAGRLISYHHNNPVRAGVVETAGQSDWSSHRYYLGLEPSPSWLHVGLGLDLYGFSNDGGPLKT